MRNIARAAPSNDITPQERGSPPLHTVSPPPLTIGGGILYHLPLNTHTRTICKKLNTRAVTARRKGAGSSGKTGLLLYTERKKKKGERNLCVCVYTHIYIYKKNMTQMGRCSAAAQCFGIPYACARCPCDAA